MSQENDQSGSHIHPISSQELTFTEQAKQRILQQLGLMLGNLELARESIDGNDPLAARPNVIEVRDAANRTLELLTMIEQASETHST